MTTRSFSGRSMDDFRHPRSNDGRAVERGQVVIVDDDLQVLRSLHFLLQAEGIKSVGFTSGLELLSARNLPNPGCFVIDYSMPDINGLDLLKKLRERRVYAPAILVTGLTDRALDHEAWKAGAELVIRKPHFDDGLIEGIKDILRRQ